MQNQKQYQQRIESWFFWDEQFLFWRLGRTVGTHLQLALNVFNSLFTWVLNKFNEHISRALSMWNMLKCAEQV